MAEPIESFTLDNGYSPFGFHNQVTVEGDQVVSKVTYNAEPFLEAAHAERQATAGERWGDGRKVGTIPMAVLFDINKQYGSAEERKHAVLCWLRDNPNLVTFEKFLR